MRAVWSFWTKPFFAERRSSWFSEFHHWLAWGLSVDAAARHYPDTQLVTDDAGARLLIDKLKLPFARVSTALNSLDGEDPGWWALGKLEAYRIQKSPFVHIDTDVFLWNALRPALASAGVIAQNPEPIVVGSSCYRPGDLEYCLGRPDRGWLPKEWQWYREWAPYVGRAECCGIFGGNHIDFIHYYARNALRIVRHARNRGALGHFEDKSGNMILLEQYLLTACLEYYEMHRGSRFDGVRIRYVFDSIGDAYSREAAAEAGFTHLAAGAKRDPAIARNLEIRVETDLPEHFARCLRMDQELAGGARANCDAAASTA